MPNPAPLPLLSVSKLGVARGDALIIDGLSFEVTAGEALHVRGQNGAGKSTLLLALAGLIPVATGEMSKASQSLGFLGHDNGLLPDLTVAQNLDAYVGSGMAPAEETADALGVPALMDKTARTLSFGQARRVALSLACLPGAKLWLLDEPFAGLDQATAEVLEGILTRHLAQGGALVFTSHDRQFSDARIIDIPEGRDDV